LVFELPAPPSSLGPLVTSRKGPGKALLSVYESTQRHNLKHSVHFTALRTSNLTEKLVVLGVQFLYDAF
jgi:hypothetical protein